MSNYHVEPADKPQALTKEAIKALRHEQVQGAVAAPAAARRRWAPASGCGCSR